MAGFYGDHFGNGIRVIRLKVDTAATIKFGITDKPLGSDAGLMPNPHKTA